MLNIKYNRKNKFYSLCPLPLKEVVQISVAYPQLLDAHIRANCSPIGILNLFKKRDFMPER